jgi:hypothetical protein
MWACWRAFQFDGSSSSRAYERSKGDVISIEDVGHRVQGIGPVELAGEVKTVRLERPSATAALPPPLGRASIIILVTANQKNSDSLSSHCAQNAINMDNIQNANGCTYKVAKFFEKLGEYMSLGRVVYF